MTNEKQFLSILIFMINVLMAVFLIKPGLESLAEENHRLSFLESLQKTYQSNKKNYPDLEKNLKSFKSIETRINKKNKSQAWRISANNFFTRNSIIVEKFNFIKDNLIEIRIKSDINMQLKFINYFLSQNPDFIIVRLLIKKDFMELILYA